MSNISDLYPSGGIGGGGLKPRFQEFLTSGTFTPSQALIDAGGLITVFLVGSGGCSGNSNEGASGGEVLEKRMYLTSTDSCIVIIGASVQGGSDGNDSEFIGGIAGGSDVIAKKGLDPDESSPSISNAALGATWGAVLSSGGHSTAGSGVNGYGAGGAGYSGGGVEIGAPNSGQGAGRNRVSGSGYCLITYWE